jgi:hypothetical protein
LIAARKKLGLTFERGIEVGHRQFPLALLHVERAALVDGHIHPGIDLEGRGVGLNRTIQVAILDLFKGLIAGSARAGEVPHLYHPIARLEAMGGTEGQKKQEE